MQSAYDTPASVERTLDRVLIAMALEGAMRERAIADTLAGQPDARAAWPAVTMLENISAKTGRSNRPTLLIAGECDRVDAPAILADRLVPFLPEPEVH